jgi:hypothetical protein
MLWREGDEKEEVWREKEAYKVQAALGKGA